MANFCDLKGKTLREIQVTKRHLGGIYDAVVFFTLCGKVYYMYHNQDRCADVQIVDICGDFFDIVQEKILLAEASTGKKADGWHFYKLATNSGSVTIRWRRESNGSVDFVERNKFEGPPWADRG
jgi:hypothetical protein